MHVEEPAYEYKVQSVKPANGSSQLLELTGGDGKIIKAYIRKIDGSIAVGTCLNKVQIERKDGKYGEYNVINNYQLAA